MTKADEIFGAKLYALPPGVDFAHELVAGLCTGLRNAPPEEMARTRLFLSSGRMQRRVREEFDRQGATFLPRLHLVSDLAQFPLPGLAPPVPALRRKLELAQLVESLARRLPAFEAGSGIFGLVDSLAALMAEMQSEGVSPEAFERLDIQASHAEHWRQSLAFIRIVARYFTAEAPPDAEARQRHVAQALADRWAKEPGPERIIVAGSTGSRGATRLLMRAVYHHPHGALVLPGFDFGIAASAWNSLSSGPIPLEDHPQYRFRQLLDELGLAFEAVKPWRDTPPADARRNALVSLALHPAPVTDQWMQDGPQLPDLVETCAGLSLIEAANPREEAQAIALALREAVEQGVKVALISPDRVLTRRVSAALGRWGIVADDSAGQPLHLSAPGRLIRHLAHGLGRRLSLEALLTLLKHPLSATGSSLRGPHLRLTREFELEARRKGPAFPTAATVLAWGVGGDDARRAWAEWLAGLLALFPDTAERSIATWLEVHLALLGHLAAGPEGEVAASALWLGEAGQGCQSLLAELSREATDAPLFSPANYADLVDTLLQAAQLRNPQQVHPQVMILGTLEARVHDAQRVILGGLSEGVWPAALAPDPWLSRKMRLDAGLLLPERQIGLSAHDFQQAIAAPEVVLARARRDSDAETVPSRWLNRMTNLLAGLSDQRGPEALGEMRARGARWLALAQGIDAPEGPAPPRALRPAPSPPAKVRPKRLSVTAIKTLIRDPYAIYARYILRLRPLDPLRPEPDPRLRGIALHAIVERFVRDFTPQDDAATAEARLLQIAEQCLGAEVPWPSAQRLWLARLARIAPQMVQDEFARRERGTPVLIESMGQIALAPLAFELTAKPDRVDLLQDGTAQLFDYKSGAPPSDKEVQLFDKQLLLEAAMIARGAFAELGPRQVSAMTYIRLGGKGETRDLPMGLPEVEQTWAGLRQLISAYATPAKGYAARRAMQRTEDSSDYDHLSRYGEWDLTETATPEVFT